MKHLRSLMLVLAALLAACAGRVPDNIGVHDGKLAPCPDTPNCVCSMEKRKKFRVQPLDVSGNATQAMQCLEHMLRGRKRMEILENNDGYIHATSSSKVFGFVDDVEFLLDAQAGVIHVRSAARLGYTDFGVNRQRAERLRRLFAAQCTKETQ